MPSLPPLAGSAPVMPGYQLTFNCTGRIFKAFVRGRNVHAASHEGILELASQCPDFEPENARLVSAIQTL